MITPYANLILAVLHEIQRHGSANPVKAPDLAAMYQVNERKITRIVAALVSCGHWIGSSKVEPMGYFYANSWEEILPTIDRRHREAVKILEANSKMLKRHPEQLELIALPHIPLGPATDHALAILSHVPKYKGSAKPVKVAGPEPVRTEATHGSH